MAILRSTSYTMITCPYSFVYRKRNCAPVDAFLHNWEISPRCLLRRQFQFLRRVLFRSAVYDRTVYFAGFRQLRRTRSRTQRHQQYCFFHNSEPFSFSEIFSVVYISNRYCETADAKQTKLRSIFRCVIPVPANYCRIPKPSSPV